MTIFKLDGPFYKLVTLIFDIVALSILWVLCCLPVVTMGASTTALFTITGKWAQGQETRLLKDFLASFHKNLKAATLFTLLLLLVLFGVIVNLLNITLFGAASQIVAVVQLVVAVEFLIAALYFFPLLSQYEMGLFSLLKTSLFMANRHLLTSVLLLGVLILMGWLIYLVPILLFAIPSYYGMWSMHLLRRIFANYEWAD